MSSDLLAAARSAVAEGRWSEALEALQRAGGCVPATELLELRAQAAYANGDFEASIGAWEEQHARLLDAGDRVGAARSAAMVAMFLMIDTGLMSPVRGWLRRAERLLEGEEECPAHAVIAAVRTYERFMCGDMAAARRQADRAIELGERLGEQAAWVIGRTAGARLTIFEGRVDEGLGQLDEIGGLLISGEVDALTCGMMLCELVCAAQGLARHDLAAEWTEVMDRWRGDAAFGGLHGRCRVHRAEILRVSGPCDAAEDEALGACDDLRPWMRREFGWPLAELGNVRLRKGDLRGAEEAFLAAHEHSWCPHPGLALVRLAQGEVAEASALIDEAIAHPFDAPSKERPPFGDLTLAPLLEGKVEIAIAAGDIDAARDAARSLRAIAERYASPWLLASAALADARTAMASGDVEAAVIASTNAIAGWTDLGAPYEAAVARVVLGEAHARSGNAARARMEWQAAAKAFDRFGARRWASTARALLDGHDDGPCAAVGADRRPSSRPAVFRRDGELRVVSFAGLQVTVRDLKGYRYLGRMLAEPGREFHVLDLVAVEQGTLPTGRADAVGAADVTRADDAGLPVLDDEARRAYRRRLDEVEDDLEDARRCNDPARAELAQRDRDYLVSELSRAVGLGGRLRTVGSDTERARTAVARTLRYAIGRLSERHAPLAQHLESSVRTGTYCSYRPDPLARVDWSV